MGSVLNLKACLTTCINDYTSRIRFTPYSSAADAVGDVWGRGKQWSDRFLMLALPLHDTHSLAAAAIQKGCSNLAS